jgi:molecular chaperone DnaK
MAEPVIGIDLGTTNSVVATVQAGTPVVIPNRSGYRLTPSVVAIAKNGKRLIGALARRQAVTNAERTVVSIKRLMGRKWSSRSTQEALARLPYTVVPHDKQRDDLLIQLGDSTCSPPEISAMVLAELRLDAEAFLGQTVTKAVITVPAYFNDSQRNATKDAGRIAGLDVIRIINEPTSASLAYGFGKQIGEKQICVFDLGGGTFDFTVLHMYKGVFEVEATGGDSLLGGDDLDNRIVDWLAQPFLEKHGIDLRKDKMSLQRLRDAAEKAKCELSSTQQMEINLPFIATAQGAGPLHLQVTLARPQLEAITRDLIDRCLGVCEQVMAEAKVKPTQLGDVLLVGGQTRMPLIQARVRQMFGREPSKAVNPDEAVALGAAIQGAMLLHQEQEMLLLDVTPHSLGIAIAGGFFQSIIPKNTTVPTSAHHVFTTVKDDQTSAKITVLQGESEIAAQNELLGEFMMTGLRKAKRGEVDIDVIFDISADGIVSVSALDVQTGLRQSITVTSSSGLTEDEIKTATKANEEWMLGQKEDPEFHKHKARAEEVFRQFDELWPRLKQAAANGLGNEPVQRAEAALSVARLQIQQKETVGLASSIERLERMLGALRGAVERGLVSPRGGSS